MKFRLEITNESNTVEDQAMVPYGIDIIMKGAKPFTKEQQWELYTAICEKIDSMEFATGAKTLLYYLGDKREFPRAGQSVG